MMNSGNNMKGESSSPAKETTTTKPEGTMTGNNNEMMMAELPMLQSMILAGSLVSHIVYGIVMGAVTTVLIRKTIPGMKAQRKNK